MKAEKQNFNNPLDLFKHFDRENLDFRFKTQQKVNQLEFTLKQRQSSISNHKYDSSTIVNKTTVQISSSIGHFFHKMGTKSAFTDYQSCYYNLGPFF
jgi:hypothetical protein